MRMNHGRATGVAIRPAIDANTNATPPPMIADRYAVFQDCHGAIVFRNPPIVPGGPAELRATPGTSAVSMPQLTRRAIGPWGPRWLSQAPGPAARRTPSQSPRGVDRRTL